MYTRAVLPDILTDAVADPELSTAKRKRQTQAFASNMTQASFERQLLAAQTAKTELEAKLRERDATIERLESDRRFLAEKENDEREERDKEREMHEEQKVRKVIYLKRVRVAHTDCGGSSANQTATSEPCETHSWIFVENTKS